MFGFQTLKVYQKAKQFHVDCKLLISRINADKKFIDQLRRASSSVPLNIAEGSGKFSPADRKNFYIIARASIFECVAILEIFKSEDKINNIDFAKLMDVSDQISRMLFRMIINLQGKSD